MKQKMDFPEATGKTVESISLYDDPPYGREVTIRFDDGTELSIEVSVEQSARGRYFLRTSNETVCEHHDQEAPLPTVEV